MKKIILTFSLLLFSAHLNALCLSYDIGAGWRNDQLNWNIAGPNCKPNVLSEVKWENLQSWQIYGNIRLVGPDCSYYRFSGNYGEIYHGKNIDRDFLGDDKTMEFSRSVNNAGKGELYDASFGYGYILSNYCNTMFIAPLWGVDIHEQKLHMFDGEQVINTITDFLGPFDGLDSKYRAKWYGSWIGFDIQWIASSCLRFFGSFEYHWSYFRAKGDWNLREDFVSDFRQKVNSGKGLIYYLGADIMFCDSWFLGIMGSYQTFYAKCGTDKVKVLVNVLNNNNNHIGTRPVTVKSRLNRVNWHSYSFFGHIGKVF